MSKEKREQILALGQLGWPLRRIEEATGVRRETASAYLRAAGIGVRAPGRWGRSPLRLPARSPNLNAYAERFVLSIKSECLDKIVPLGERHLRYAIREYVEHYHRERHHQGLGSAIITPEEARRVAGRIRRRQRLGGTLNHYYREAA